MDKLTVIERTKEYVQTLLTDNDVSHDWWHIQRVSKMACYLAEKEQADLFIVEMSALLHDIDDWKFNQNNEPDDIPNAKSWLEELLLPQEVSNAICEVIRTISFRGAMTESNTVKSIEAAVVQDADRLDAMGAIGIARTFSYGGHTSRVLHDPARKPMVHKTFKEYKKNEGTTLNHFHEKLLLLKDRMNTDSAKKIAENRHVFMEKFLEQFLHEWDFGPN